MRVDWCVRDGAKLSVAGRKKDKLVYTQIRKKKIERERERERVGFVALGSKIVPQRRIAPESLAAATAAAHCSHHSENMQWTPFGWFSNPKTS